MSVSTDRRHFLGASVAAATAGALAGLAGSRGLAAEKTPQEYYELRTFEIQDAKAQAIVHGYLEKALLPALRRQGIDRIGVFQRVADADQAPDPALELLIPVKSLELLGNSSSALFADGAYVEAAKEYFARAQKEPLYRRLNSRLMKAFASLPALELPAASRQKSERIFELRIYESHHEDAAFRKVDMFNQGETEIMREVGLAPVFFGETLISEDVPNLTYMLSAPDMPSHREHWKAFSAHPEWKRMKSIEKYKGTVSKIINRFLEPTSYSEI